MIPNTIKSEIKIKGNIPLNWALTAMFSYMVCMMILDKLLSFPMLVLFIINVELFIIYLFIPYGTKRRNYNLLLDLITYKWQRRILLW